MIGQSIIGTYDRREIVKVFKNHGLEGAMGVFLGVSLALVAGCTPSPPRGTLVGSVQYQGTALQEGTVQMYSPSLGEGGMAAIAADGSFTIEALPPGKYELAIEPPEVLNDYGGKAAPGYETKEMKNIPAKYRQFETSGLEVTIAEGDNSIDVVME